ncbi:serine hydrolase [Aphanothece sacrum]|uniref:Beta-lactamase n=1 Tax=Aphanothece sacrum FPU1 TaxID=1920663 RepID=A0A401IJY6_APHSA|nr:serine hydrolase [Aphanothece sacrum]GBF81421.1 beta-lactamase [Aphanothece sacrum FPU1]GBF85388.1 beta-lactamase [Aphanothece sacrum FPU3]
MSRRIVNPSSSNKNTTNSPSRRSVKARSSQSRQRINMVSGKANSDRDNTIKESSTLTVSAKRVDTPSRQRNKPRPPNIIASALLYVLRFAIMGVGIGAIAGTAFTVFDPTGFLATYLKFPSSTATPQKPAPIEVEIPQETPSNEIILNQELTNLKTKLQAIAAKYPKVKPQAWFLDLDNGAYINLGGSTPIPAASTIKIPVLVAFFEEVDKGNIHLDQMLIMDKEVITTGSGDMQYMQVGKKFTALEVATKMIIISDNTATDMLIRQIGGKEVLNQRFKEWGLTHTVINNRLPDLEGTNTTSSEDLGKLLAKVERGDFLSPRSRDRLLAIMEKTKTRTLLPQGIEKEANIAHKTGDIGTILGDAGIIDIPTGKRYIGVAFAQRAYNDPAARSLIQEFSRTVYQHFKYYQTRPTPKVIENKPKPPAQPTNSNIPENKPKPQGQADNSNHSNN